MKEEIAWLCTIERASCLIWYTLGSMTMQGSPTQHPRPRMLWSRVLIDFAL